MSFSLDILQLILDILYLDHTSAWDEEFRADAHRAPFTRYALISKAWTLPAQIYVYRSTCIHWQGHLDSVRVCLSHLERGRPIRDCVRVLDVQVCANNSTTAIPLKDLPSVLSMFSQISELRLRAGPAINALWTRPSQERQLRAAVAHLKGTLRAVQVSVCRGLHSNIVVKQTYELFPPSQLSFLSIATHDRDRGLPVELPSNEWSIFDIPNGEDLHWPFDTNTRDTSVSSSYPIYPVTLRVHSPSFPPHFHNLLTSFASRLRYYVGPVDVWEQNHALRTSRSMQKVVFPVRERLCDSWGCLINPLRERGYVYSLGASDPCPNEAEYNSSQKEAEHLLQEDLRVDFGQPSYRSSAGYRADPRSLEEAFMGCLDVRTYEERVKDFSEDRNLYPTWPRIFVAVRKDMGE